MGAFIAKQPNGLYCRFSTVVDTITHYNMTFDDYVNDVQICRYGRSRQEAEAEARDTIEHYLRSFQEIIDSFVPRTKLGKSSTNFLEEMGYVETFDK